MADQSTGNWLLATTQSSYKVEVGRDYLRFLWTHYAPDARRIDPSVSNVMDTYLLTSAFDSAYRTWIITNGLAADEPIPPTADDLRVEFQDFDNFKMESDAIIYHSSRYKPLFGSKADPALQATFKIVQSPGSSISQNDLVLRVLRVIDLFFAVDKWDFGGSFYFTELSAFIHTALAPDIQSAVIVPKDATQAFGRLFQIRSEPDELLISCAQATDVEIITNLSDIELQIGTF